LTDSEIIAGLGSANQLLQSRAVGVLLKQIKDPLVHYVKQNSGSREEGLEMANEAIVALWRSSGEGKFELRADVKLSTWCVSVGRNLWLKELRRRRTKGGDNPIGVAGNEPSDGITPYDILTTVEEHRLVSNEMQRAWRAFKKLGSGCQHLFQADLEDKPEEEIMRLLEVTNLGSVKVKRHRCKEKWIELYKLEPHIASNREAETVTDERRG
jgi:RNA polymerase sigma factor (sigma-70 family)